MCILYAQTTWQTSLSNRFKESRRANLDIPQQVQMRLKHGNKRKFESPSTEVKRRSSINNPPLDLVNENDTINDALLEDESTLLKHCKAIQQEMKVSIVYWWLICFAF